MISGKYLFSYDHILYSKIRPNLNKVADPGFCGLCSADVYPIKLDHRVCLKRFAYHFLLSEAWYGPAVAASMRTGLPKVNRDYIDGIEFLLPSIAEQGPIVAVLDAWDGGITIADALAARKRRRFLAARQRLIEVGQISASNVVLRAPDVVEQRKIGAALQRLEDDVKLSERAADTLRTQKRGLMQKLLTGEWRLRTQLDQPAIAPPPVPATTAI
jgi:restriction endonuclease S subunit